MNVHSPLSVRLALCALALPLAAGCSGRGASRAAAPTVEATQPPPTSTDPNTAVEPPPAPPATAADLAPWAAYQSTPNAAANMPNNSFSGYHMGDDALPNNANQLDVTQAAYGARSDGSADATTAVRRAIADAARTGQVVYFPAGTYSLSGPLFVGDSNVVLRGAGQSATTLTFHASLTQTVGQSVNSAGSSNWGEEGGMVWFSPRSVMTYAQNPMPSRTYWNLGNNVASVSGPAKRGDTELPIAAGSRVQAGMWLALQVSNPGDNSLNIGLAGGNAWATAYPWASASAVAGTIVTWPFEVVAVKAQSLTLRQPLRFDVAPAFNPQIFPLAQPVRESGIENMTVALDRPMAWDPNTSHHHELGYNGVFFSNCVDCFARAVTVVDAEGLAFGVTAGKRITLTGIHTQASTAAMAPHHHAVVVRADAQDVLVDTFSVDSQPMHGLSTSARAMGVVFTRGQMAHGTFDAHKALPMDVLFTDISLHDDGQSGGDQNAGPDRGARFVTWNVRVDGPLTRAAAPAATPMGTIAGVPGAASLSPVDPSQGDSGCFVGPDAVPNPANLYDAQLQLRLNGP